MGPRRPKPIDRSSNSKAPALAKQAKKKRPYQAQAHPDGRDDELVAGSAGPSTRNVCGARDNGRSKKSQRSFWGFVGVAASAVALWGWAVVQHTEQRRRNRAVLDAMLRRPLTFTEHAACRMDCRFVTRQQVRETLRRGEINAWKSNLAERPCPKYVVDAELDSKAVQGVFSACKAETKVLTVIDKSTNWPCGPC